jgi:hypothetical protein
VTYSGTGFQNKTAFVSKQAEANMFGHFSILCRTCVSSCTADKHSTVLSKPHEEFCIPYKYLKKAENKIQLLTCPFSFDGEKVPGNLQLQPTDLQSCIPWISESRHFYTPAVFNLLCHSLLII